MARGISIDLIVDPKQAIAGIGKVQSSASDVLGNLVRVAGGAILDGLGTGKVFP